MISNELNIDFEGLERSPLALPISTFCAFNSCWRLSRMFIHSCMAC